MPPDSITNQNFKMSKTNVAKNFGFLFPLSHKVVRDLRSVTEHIGDLMITGTAYLNVTAQPTDPIDEKYSVDIDFIIWNGTDIKPVLECTEMISDLQEAALQHATGMSFFTEEPATYDDMMGAFFNSIKKSA